MTDVASDRHRAIVDAAGQLLESGGEDAVSTRAVSAAAGVQAPTIYRLFGDKQGLLDAVASAGFESYLAGGAVREPTDDPVADLCTGWDTHIGLALARPALYTVMYARSGSPGLSPAARRAFDVLSGVVHRIAVAGRLRVAEQRAVDLLHAAGHGTALSLIAVPAHERDPALSHAARDAVLGAILTPSSSAAHGSPGPGAAAVTLRAALPDLDMLSDAERALMREWLDRVAAAQATDRAGRRAPPGLPASTGRALY